MNAIISSVLSSVRQTFTVYIRSGLSIDLLKKFIDLLDQGISVEILIEEENSSSLRQDPSLFHHCGKFVDKGGSIILVACNEPVNAFFLIDYKSVCFVSPSSAKRQYDEIQHKEYLIKTRRYIEGLKNRGSSYLQDAGDISIHLEANTDIIKMGESVQISWNVKGATEVSIHGIGPVAAHGTTPVVLYDNTIIKIKARNSRHTQVRTFYVRVFGDVEINYDLGFLNPVTKQYSSLVNAENYPDVFGIMKGHSVQFNWEVNEAETVSIRPFNLKEKKGTHTFSPASSFDIEIEAHGNGQTVLRRIQINLFPVPVFHEKKHRVNDRWYTQEYTFSLPDVGSRLKEEHLSGILKNAEERYASMGERVKELSEAYSGEITPEVLRDKMLMGMKQKYSIKQEVMVYVQKLMKEVKELRNIK